MEVLTKTEACLVLKGFFEEEAELDFVALEPLLEGAIGK